MNLRGAFILFGITTLVRFSAFPQGTAFITDAGMTGSLNSVIGMQKEPVLERFLTQMPQKFEVAANDVIMQGVVVSIDVVSGKAMAIERINIPL